MRVNREIRVDRVRVILEDGTQLGVLTIRDALGRAEEMGLDLVEVAPQAVPPVCKIINFGKFRYHQTKKEKESKKSQHQVKVKEIKFKPNIDEHDFQTKLKQAREFLDKGNKVRITCTFRGREMLHTEVGGKVVQKFCDLLADLAIMEAPIKLMGRASSTVLAPQGKKIVVKKKEMDGVQDEK
ncbi:MAG: translation initiation factor IF-3 [Chlamydiota bacterium]